MYLVPIAGTLLLLLLLAIDTISLHYLLTNKFQDEGLDTRLGFVHVAGQNAKMMWCVCVHAAACSSSDSSGGRGGCLF